MAILRRAAAALALVLGLLASPAPATASCASSTPRQQLASASVVFEGLVLGGAARSREELPNARFHVIRYLKGRGPAVLLVRVGQEQPLDGGRAASSVDADVRPGQVWRIFATGRVRPSSGEAGLATSDCAGNVLLGSRRYFAPVPGSTVTARGRDGRSVWVATVQRGPAPVACLRLRRLAFPLGRGGVAIGCERLGGPRAAMVEVVTRGTGADSSTAVAVVSPRATEVVLSSPDGPRRLRRSPTLRPAVFVFPGRLEPYRFGVRLSFAQGLRRFFDAGAGLRVAAADPTSDLGWVARAAVRRGLTCAGFRRQAPRFADPPPESTGFETCGDLRRQPFFVLVDSVTCLACGGQAGMPVRTGVLGAVGPAVASLALRGPAGEVAIPMARRGRAFLAVLPPSTSSADLTLVIRFANGRVEELAGVTSANLRRPS